VSWSLRLALLAAAAVISLHLCIDTGLVGGWGKWYSPSTQYREQTDALLERRFALSSSPKDVEFDMAWAEGGVQQVWGLGVPLWRMPFEFMAKLWGQPAFPDRLELGAAVLVVAFMVLRAFTTSPTVRTISDWFRYSYENPLRVIAALILLSFPPILALCRSRFDVYEEASFYAYYSAVALFAGTYAFSIKPRVTRYIAIGALAGFAGFIRPTALAYGASSILVTFVCARRGGWGWRKCLLAPSIFCGLFLMLLYSNAVRFGAPLEFGHRVNLSGQEMKYISRFPSPFDGVSLFSAAKELFGSIFFVRNFNGYQDAYRDGLVVWQSETPRWRCFYTTTFDISYMLVMFLSWLWAVAVGLRALPKNANLTRRDLVVCAAWSFCSFIPLFAFYLHYCAMSSRYMLDFAPSIGASVVGCALAFNGVCGQEQRAGRLLAAALVAVSILWFAFENAAGEAIFAPVRALSQSEMIQVREPRQPGAVVFPNAYSADSNPATTTGIRDNGSGWEHPTGNAASIVVLFVRDASKLVLDLAPTPGKLMTGDAESIVQAKIGLEKLHLEGVQNLDHGKTRLTFGAPKRAAFRQGVQVVFLAFSPAYRFRDEVSAFRLLRVEWR
jgi:hypothetical protein